MGNILDRKRQKDDDDLVYHTIPSYEGKNANDVYKTVTEKYQNYCIYMLSNRLTVKLLNKSKIVIIYCNHDNNTVQSVEIYD